MPRIKYAIAAAICLMLTAMTAAAQKNPEGRGYGGALNVGPNFQQGGQHTPPVYGPKQKKKSPGAAVKKHKAPATKEVKKTTPSKEAAEDSTAEDAGPDGPEAADASRACTRFDATTGTTVQIPCE